MLKVGLIGFGFMGHMHMENYVRLQAEGVEVELVAICDLLIEELKHQKVEGNIATDSQITDLSKYRLYADIEEMLSSEQLDMVSITLPTYLHADLTCDLLGRGYHVLCEKPMALNSADGRRMIAAAEQSGKKLMIGQCLRFWPAYEYLKETVDSGRFGAATGGYFFRGGATPDGWFRIGEKSGGAMLDMHIHDTDAIHWIFGKPEKVLSMSRNVVPGSGYDIVSTNYSYADGKVINAQCDWTLQGDYGFSMVYRVNFEKGNIVFENNQVKVNPNDAPGFIAELSPDMGYYREIRYFVESVMNDTPITTAEPVSTLGSLEIIEAEILSADRRGEAVTLGSKNEPSPQV
ncbi:Gfo/Idh/MocA family protein [Paenibacillus sepulcri]|uniref:Gfo/Idh/MocA family oxidoreductase n=1 Tax=Paenibacillus sepulcri TaxID=359917 RepID=A0ABS7C249_9BACL|nr:Gfo/Idh/MocA family oxidoreductase [Paenibacillus sepulcri]